MADGSPDRASLTSACRHCGRALARAAVPAGGWNGFCCAGCAGAHAIVAELGLERYYERRTLVSGVRPPRPLSEGEEEGNVDPTPFVAAGRPGVAQLNLLVEGLHCGACVWLIESVLRREAGVLAARLALGTHRLTLSWRAGEADPARLIDRVQRLGYRLVPFSPATLALEEDKRSRALLRALAVAGFAAGNIMILSVAVWAGAASDMAPATRDLFHWVSALIALPTIAFAGRPFFGAALAGLRARRATMDLPIALALIITPAASLVETIHGGAHVYFDSSVMLLFFLLVGRYLETRARDRARQAARALVTLTHASVMVLDPLGFPRALMPGDLAIGMTMLVARGVRLGADGEIIAGASSIDTSLITGESVPVAVAAGERVHAGTLNLASPIRVRIDALGEGTVLAEIVRLMEAAEQGRARFVAIAERVARTYSPFVHVMALATFVGWLAGMGAGWHIALLHAVAVLIITCPCALALAVPVVQVAACGHLMRRGILVKSPSALERLCTIDRIVFDKTGTLTTGRLNLIEGGEDDEALALASRMAASSHHPLARALSAALPSPALCDVAEFPGMGLERQTPEGPMRLGNARFCGVAETSTNETGPELWLTRPGRPAWRFRFADRAREDAASVIACLKTQGLAPMVLSGDRVAEVARVAETLGIEEWHGALSPMEKTERLARLAAEGHHVLMVGDGINDAPALAAAWVSASPVGAADIAQAAADLVFQGRRLDPVLDMLATARRAVTLVRQNLAFSLLYNLCAIPLAVMGYITPLVAALAMSGSSLLVVANALRLERGRP